MTRLSVSIPEELSRQLERLRRHEGAKTSHVVAEALREYFARRGAGVTTVRTADMPTVLLKLKAAGRVTLRSPRLTERRIREGWVIEEY